MNWAFAGWAFAAGMLIPVMAALNGALGRAIGSPTWAAVALFAIGLVATLAFTLATSGGPPFATLSRARPEQFLGGLIVAFYVLSVTYLTPKRGVR